MKKVRISQKLLNLHSVSVEYFASLLNPTKPDTMLAAARSGLSEMARSGYLVVETSAPVEVRPTSLIDEEDTRPFRERFLESRAILLDQHALTSGEVARLCGLEEIDNQAAVELALTQLTEDGYHIKSNSQSSLVA